MYTIDTAQQRLTDALELGNEAAAATARGMHWLAARKFDRVLEELRAAERAVLLARDLTDQAATEKRAAGEAPPAIQFEPLPEYADLVDDPYSLPHYLRQQAS
jgi:hypothetical protein